MKTSDVEIVAELPATPLLVMASDTLVHVAHLSESAATLRSRRIASPQEAESAATLLREVIDLGRLIESRRVTVKAPFLEMSRKIDEAVKPHTRALEDAARVIKPALSAWQTEQERRAREAEAKRQAEIAAAERNRIKAEQDAAAAAKAATATNADEFADFDVMAAEAKVAQAEAQVNLASARAIVAPSAPQGINYRTTLKPEIVDVQKIPTAFVIITPNLEAIRKAYCNGWKEGDPLPMLSGVRFVADKQPIMARR